MRVVLWLVLAGLWIAIAYVMAGAILCITRARDIQDI
jgi:uncharacterized membrane protein YccF (DUF307 family)